MSRRKLAGSAFTLVPPSAATSDEIVEPKKATTASPSVVVPPARGQTDGEELVELDPALVEPSPFADRLKDDDHERFDAFAQTIAEHGQQVPIRVRQHPHKPGHFQVVYGHRRLAAARHLKISIKAHVVEIDDRALAVAQGIENSARQDLSWIERALFARRMDEAKFRPRDIYTALSIDDAELARMRSVCRHVPIDIIEAIGRAPKIGRPRWVALAKSFAKNTNAVQNIRDMLQSERIRKMGSDARFSWVHELIAESRSLGTGNSPLREADGFGLGEIKYTSKELRIVAANERGKAFADFVRTELPRLIDEFSALDIVTPKNLSADSDPT
ncbi:MAG TPA: plasmid partitioning protein RepB [Ensifer sp.]|nr:plasmid partitioning protein RepB [Ensifer sp.]